MKTSLQSEQKTLEQSVDVSRKKQNLVANMIKTSEERWKNKFGAALSGQLKISLLDSFKAEVHSERKHRDEERERTRHRMEERHLQEREQLRQTQELEKRRMDEQHAQEQDILEE